MSNKYESDSETEDSPMHVANPQPKDVVPPPPLNLVANSPLVMPIDQAVREMSPLVAASPVEEWANFDSTKEFYYKKFSSDDKKELWNVTSKYYIYCNFVDKTSFPTFVGTSNQQIKNIVSCLLIWGGGKEWSKKFKERINYTQFFREYYSYIATVDPSEKDSFQVNKIMKTVNYNSHSYLKYTRDKIFHNILTKYYEKYGSDYNLEKVQEFGAPIYMEEMGIDEMPPLKISYIFKQFTQYVAGLTEADFPEIKKIHNSSGFEFPREFWTSIDNIVKKDDKEDKDDSKKRKRTEVEILNIKPETKRSRKGRISKGDIITLTNFLESISKDTFEDVFKLRELQEAKDKETHPAAQPVPELNIDRKKSFIKTLPFTVYKILKDKGGVDLSGFIKVVQLTTEEEKLINSVEILYSLYENGLIQ